MRTKDRENFKRLAELRVNNAIKILKLIGNLSNKSNYSYSKNDIDKIFNTLNAEIKKCRGRFDEKDSGNEKQFKLD